MPSRQQLKQLQLALINAFPSKSLLERLLYFELEKNLHEITKDSDLQDIVFKLIQTAESQGWLIDLVRAARKENSGNSELEAIALELPSPETPSAPKRSPEVVNSDSAIHDKYYEWFIGKYKNYETEGLSSLGSLFLLDVFVPLKVAPNYPTNARHEMIPLRSYDMNSQKRIWDFLVATTSDDSTSIQPSIVVLGAPGSGKTTLLKHLAYVYAKKEQKKHFEEAPELIPVLLLIRDVYPG